jgi:two-component system OmpR family response regulator
MTKALSARGHRVHEASDGGEGLLLACTENYDVLVLNRALPTLDGPGLVRELRERGVEAKILMLAELNDLDSLAEGASGGANDFLVKPFAFTELIARINTLVLWVKPAADGPTFLLRLGDLELNLVDHRARRSGRLISLQPREWHLLEYLMRHAGDVVTRAMLLEHVWGRESSKTSLVETHISRLRDKIDRDFPGPRLLTTVRGEGYVLGPTHKA